jgi:hypothetical protein
MKRDNANWFNTLARAAAEMKKNTHLPQQVRDDVK